MSQHLLFGFLYAVPASAVAALSLQAAVSLSAAYAELRLKAAEQQRDVPPLAAFYFRNTVRVLFVTALLFVVFAGADVVVSVFLPQRGGVGILGYGSGVALLVCGFGLLLQGRTDAHLELFKPVERWAHTIGGAVGIATAAWGMVLVTWQGNIWPTSV